MSSGTGILARRSAQHPWRVVAIWALTLSVAGMLTSSLLGSALTSEVSFTDSPESIRAQELIEELRGENPSTEFVIVTSDTATIEDQRFVEYVAAIQNAIEQLGADVVADVGSYLSGDGPVAESGRTALLPTVISGKEPDVISGNAEAVSGAVASIPSPDGIEAMVGGQATLNNDFNHLAEEDLRTGETIGIGVAMLVLIVVFGTIASGVIPIIVGLVAIGVALGAAAVIGQAFDLSFFITNMIMMIGLAVGIDYSLFIVSRYREERSLGFAKFEAIERAGTTATRAVVFSGLTVVLALVGMLILPNTLFRALGLGAILVVIAAVVASMTLLPAVLSLMGDRINSLRVRRKGSLDSQSQLWDRIAKGVMRRPVISLVLSAGILLIAATSFTSIETGLGGVSNLPDEVQSARAFAVLEQEFSGGLTSPVEIVVEGDDAIETASEVQAALAEHTGYGPSSLDPTSAAGLAVVSVQLLGDPASVESMEAVANLRDVVLPAVDSHATIYVGGQTAITVDFQDQVDSYTPVIFAVVLGLSFLLLMVAFRSVVIPGKAIAMNLLSVGAAYGLIVAFFQVGVGPSWVKEIADFLGFTQVDAIEAWIPLFLFSVLFGLSMDYHVFLLSRIKERFDQTNDNTESVAYGLRTTGALITGAAAIMVAVFAGFAAGKNASFQQMGFGLAAAVLLDATIVRTVLVPATMRLLGNSNWYLPRWLEWIPNISVEGHLDEVSVDTQPMDEKVSA